MVIAADGTKVITQGNGDVQAFDKNGDPLGQTINAGEGGDPNLSDQNLFDQEKGQEDYTQDQLDEYQNYYGGDGGGDVDD
jgi:hypothetical protein